MANLKFYLTEKDKASIQEYRTRVTGFQSTDFNRQVFDNLRFDADRRRDYLTILGMGRDVEEYDELLAQFNDYSSYLKRKNDYDTASPLLKNSIYNLGLG